MKREWIKIRTKEQAVDMLLDEMQKNYELTAERENLRRFFVDARESATLHLAERDEARRIARQMKAERDEWRARALEIAKAFKEYDDAAQGFEYTTPTD